MKVEEQFDWLHCWDTDSGGVDAGCCSMSSWAMTQLGLVALSAAFWRHLVAFNVEPNLEVLALVAVAVAHVSFQFIGSEKTLRASRELASATKLGK